MEQEITEVIKNLFTENKNSEELRLQRLQANTEIIEIIAKYIKENPNQRFIQALWNLDIVNKMDRYNEEPMITIKRIKHRLEQSQQIKKNINPNTEI